MPRGVRHVARIDDLPRDEENATQCETDMMYHQSTHGDILFVKKPGPMMY